MYKLRLQLRSKKLNIDHHVHLYVVYNTDFLKDRYMLNANQE